MKPPLWDFIDAGAAILPLCGNFFSDYCAGRQPQGQDLEL